MLNGSCGGGAELLGGILLTKFSWTRFNALPAVCRYESILRCGYVDVYIYEFSRYGWYLSFGKYCIEIMDASDSDDSDVVLIDEMYMEDENGDLKLQETEASKSAGSKRQVSGGVSNIQKISRESSIQQAVGRESSIQQAVGRESSVQQAVGRESSIQQAGKLNKISTQKAQGPEWWSDDLGGGRSRKSPNGGGAVLKTDLVMKLRPESKNRHDSLSARELGWNRRSVESRWLSWSDVEAYYIKCRDYITNIGADAVAVKKNHDEFQALLSAHQGESLDFVIPNKVRRHNRPPPVRHAHRYGRRVELDTLLGIAVSTRCTQCCKMLLSAQADPNIQPQSQFHSPLFVAVENLQAGMITLLREHGADPFYQDVLTGETALHVFALITPEPAMFGIEELCGVMEGSDIGNRKGLTNIVNVKGQTALHVALMSTYAYGSHDDRERARLSERTLASHRRDDSAIIKELLEYGARLDLRDSAGNTPLNLRCQDFNCGYDDSVTFRELANESVVNIANKDGKTPFMYLVAHGLELYRKMDCGDHNVLKPVILQGGSNMLSSGRRVVEKPVPFNKKEDRDLRDRYLEKCRGALVQVQEYMKILTDLGCDEPAADNREWREYQRLRTVRKYLRYF